VDVSVTNNKESIMKSTHVVIIALLGAAIATPALSQPGPGRGGRYAIDSTNTTGWSLMTAEERGTHQQKMWSFKNYDECKAYQQEHHQAMEVKAKDQGKTLPAPRANACDRMQKRGLFK
jgi:hypothetical protein